MGINVGGDETDVQKEHFGRNVQRILRGEERPIGRRAPPHSPTGIVAADRPTPRRRPR